ncbi:hypothetical protein ATANTOWER_025922 [Ataeniobius toweri]|uniref:Uncharacterized protein n=1 Tax=Ataeniobius toweri TaxID=208326 RepID=A0ABU7B044_9TELE|nr:hypothetical protein [Ataeniobius toweri]
MKQHVVMKMSDKLPSLFYFCIRLLIVINSKNKIPKRFLFKLLLMLTLLIGIFRGLLIGTNTDFHFCQHVEALMFLINWLRFHETCPERPAVNPQRNDRNVGSVSQTVKLVVQHY